MTLTRRAASPVLVVEDLSVWFRTPGGTVQALCEASFSLAPGETLVVIGESGSGKTVLAHALMRLLQRNTAVSGRVRLGGTSLLDLSEREMEAVRRRRLALIPQSAGAALNPVRQVGSLLLEGARARGLGADAAREQLSAILDELGLRFDEVAGRYPHELSGGQQQRVVNAAAMVGRPELVIADEPTFGLDADLVATTAAHLRAITARGAALLLITHDLRLAEQMHGRLAVIYASYLVELRESGAFFAGVRGAPGLSPPWGEATRSDPAGAPSETCAGIPAPGPAHPYSRALLRAMPEFGGRPIPGPSPELSALPAGCPFQDRCPEALPVCATTVPPPIPLPAAPAAPIGGTPPLAVLGAGYVDDAVRCHLHAPR
jgi:peptide/nickel transport system ATP-binding protein